MPGRFATGAARQVGASEEPVLGIGEVLARLRPEFPDITVSKLRFLEAEGLVEPLRAAPSGYRKYTAAHVRRLRFVLTAQRDRYLPLRVIREQLGALDRGERVVGLPPADAAGIAPAGVATTVELTPSELTRAELAQRCGLDEAGLADLERYGLLSPSANGRYDAEALTVARVAAALARFGLQARHLRPYRAAADRDVGLLAALVAPMWHQSAPGGRQRALETVHELAGLCAQLHAALVRQGLSQALGG